MMVKNEQFRTTDQLKRVVPLGPMGTLSTRPPIFQTTSGSIPQRSIDPRAIDISSIKGRFAWEKIALGDTYIPVIFRGTTKYFCVKMLNKLLPEYPEDVIRRSSYYQYRKPIDLYLATSNELELLNKINVHHCNWAYSVQPFTITDELIRVSDFLPFYEHLRLFPKSSPIPRTPSAGSLRAILPQPQKSMLRSPDFVVNTTNIIRGNSTTSVAKTAIQKQPCTVSEPPRENISTVPRSIAPAPFALRPQRPPKNGAPQFAARQSLQHPSTQPQQQSVPPSSMEQPLASSSNSAINSTNTVLSNKPWTAPAPTSASQSSKTITPVSAVSSTPPEPITPSPLATSSRKLSTISSEKQLPSIPKQLSSSSLEKQVPSISKQLSSSSSEKQVPSISKQLSSSSSEKQVPSISKQPSSTKPVRLHSGWLQINKLYTPYVSISTSNHHLYKIPISLLTFYDLLKLPSSENNPNESKDSSYLSKQTLVTPQEIELINELCLKQSIKPFSIDTKLISLSTFYEYCSANILFVKELPLNEPKASICKIWSTIVQINGGICRLRNTTTLHEQTVPFIGNNLLKNFIISAQSLTSAKLTTPTAAEVEFLQLILFFSNISINLRNARLIDIESVQKEYNVDLILLFNDKFPLNVLNYQQQGNRPSTSQEQVNQTESSAATNTFAESTPPPSPLSPVTNNVHVNPTAQLPLTQSSASTPTTRYQKTITFHGHTMTAYICSGLGSNAQRECISVTALCNILYPNSSILDKLETRMLRLLRLKGINRFRPQNQQTMSSTRLIDVKDVEKHWDYIEKGMCSLTNNNGETNFVREITSSLASNDLRASTLDKVENKSKEVEQFTSIEVYKGEKRPLEREMEKVVEGNVSIFEQMDKRIRFSEDDNDEQPRATRSQTIKTIDKKTNHSDDDESTEEEEDDDDDDNKKPLENRRRSIPSIKIVRRKTNKTNKKPIQPQSDRGSSKSAITLRKPIVPVKKKIKLMRKRFTPRIRSSKQVVAAWVKKYGIEDCCIRLNLYDPIYETGKD